MDLYTLLTSLRDIRPDEGYTKRSRAQILAGAQSAHAPTYRLWDVILRNVRSRNALAFASVVLLIFGGVVSYQLVSLFRPASLDPAALRAEAQAIEAQIMLADIAAYDAREAVNAAVAPEASARAPRKNAPAPPESRNETSLEIATDAAPPPDVVPSIDEILEDLSR